MNTTSVLYEGFTSVINTAHLVNATQETPAIVRIVKDVAMCLMIGVTVTGNGFVILSFVVDAKIRTQSNYFLLNLAICDFCIGTFSVPLFMVNYIMNGSWILGRQACKLWLAIDYVICQCSIYTIVLISYDRYLAVTKAVAYRDQQHKMKPTILKIMLAWVLAFIVYGPVIIFWEYIAGFSNIPNGECNPEFFYNQYFRSWSFVIFFFTPLVAILYFNVNLFINIRNRMKAKPMPFIAPARSDKTAIFKIPYSQSIKDNRNTDSDAGRTKSRPPTFKEIRMFQNFLPNKSMKEIIVLENPTKKHLRISAMTVQTMSLSMDKKIAKSLAILVGVFCLCWAPYSLLMIVREIYSDNCIPTELSDTTYLFTYVNSSLNPFIYPLCHPAFKSAFIKLLSHLMCGFKLTWNKTTDTNTTRVIVSG